jgi:hypothetical protein
MYLFTSPVVGVEKAPGECMTNQQRKTRELIIEGVKESVARALDRHKKLGESVAVWKDGKVVMLKPSQIPMRSRRQSR